MVIGYIGLGAMGAPMTARLAQAFPGAVRAFDADAAAVARVCTGGGAAAAASVAEIAEASDLLFTCLPDEPVARSVYLGPRGVSAAIRSGAVTIDCSTVSPGLTRAVHAAMAERGVAHLDASILGSAAQAARGEIGFLVGGDAAALARARPALAACGRGLRHAGPSGAGCRLKLIVESVAASHAVAVAEALGLCLETGADPAALLALLAGDSAFVAARADALADGALPALFSLRFMLKDARLALALTDGAAEKFPGLAATVATLEQADAAGHGRDDCSAVLRAVEARIGRRVHRGG